MKKAIQTYDWNLKELKPLSTYADKRIAIVEKISDVGMDESVRLNAFIILLCTQGSATFFINGEQRAIQPGDLLICQPHLILEKKEKTDDYRMQAIFLTSEYVEQLTFLKENAWNIKVFLQKHPILPLQREEIDNFQHYYHLLRDRLTGVQRKYQDEIIDGLVQIFFYEFVEIIERFVQTTPETHTSADSLFQAFIKLLESEYPKQRSVAYYADRLYITPKYLSAVVKNVSGETASQLINQAVMNDIRVLLKRSRKSIKEVAHELDFPNLSFFGKYVKRYSGLSPKQLREQNNGKE